MKRLSLLAYHVLVYVPVYVNAEKESLHSVFPFFQEGHKWLKSCHKFNDKQKPAILAWNTVSQDTLTIETVLLS